MALVEVNVDILRFKTLTETATIPTRGSAQAAGMDLYADEDMVLIPGERKAVSTGIAMALPPGHEGQVRPRSGNALKLGLTVLNSPGTVDPDYRGEVKVILINLSAVVQAIKRGDRIAQLVIAKFEPPEVFEVDTLDDTARGEGGFGSTGK